MGTWNPDRNGPEQRGHDGGKERQEQGEVGRKDKEDKSQGKEEKERPKEQTNTDGDTNANARGATSTRRRRQEKAGGQSRKACTRTSEDERGGKEACEEHTASTRTGEQEPGGPGRRTYNTAHNACTPVNRSQGAQDTVHMTRRTEAGTPANRSQAAQDTAHATTHSERAGRSTGTKRPRTPHPQHHTQSVHAGEQEPGGPGNGARNTTHRACMAVNRSQEAQDTARTTQHTERAHR